MDHFASLQNTQLETFFSWKSNLKAKAVNALAHNFYNMFPPIAIIGRANSLEGQTGEITI